MRTMVRLDGETAGARASLFTTTHWSVVLAAREKQSGLAREALESLCKTYWYPLYVFVRRYGYGPEDAQDLTQEFFAHLLRKDALANVGQEKGLFRAFLLSCLKHFLADARDRANAQKRGGGQRTISFEDTDAEARYQLEPMDNSSPDRVFERKWAYALLAAVMARLRRKFQEAGKAALFDAFHPFLAGEPGEVTYLEVATRLGITEAAAKMTVTRMRRRYRQLLREEVENTVDDPAETDVELRFLLAALQ